ncbi:MAG TPA: hypothetical protein VMZ73_08855 [Acidimicrobiales bacterium]|nr:hypothetical protein [Acidimicrobiales bacterium]
MVDPRPSREEGERPVPVSWRPVLSGIVRAFVNHDYGLAGGVESVDPVPETTARQVAAAVENYGATLVELTAGTWQSSITQWTGWHWEVLVDLRTAEEGRSDLSLFVDVRPADSGYRFTVEGVWVE